MIILQLLSSVNYCDCERQEILFVEFLSSCITLLVTTNFSYFDSSL